MTEIHIPTHEMETLLAHLFGFDLLGGVHQDDLFAIYGEAGLYNEGGLHDTAQWIHAVHPERPGISSNGDHDDYWKGDL